MSEERNKKARGNKRKSGGNFRILILVFAVILVVILAMTLVSHFKKEKAQEKNAKGVAYLKSLEKQDVSKIQKKIKSNRASIGLALADTDESAVWAAMTDEVILGDSRAVGFSYYEFMSEDHVFAESGKQITDAVAYLDQLEALQPTEIFLCYGLNDIKSGNWPTADAYATEYETQVKTLKKKLPDTTIYINSILPATGEGLASDSVYSQIDEYNSQLKSMCEKNDWPYIDNTDVAKAHEDLYETDGLHLVREFYKYWAANMLSQLEN